MKTKRLPRMGIHVLLVGFLTAWGAGAAAPADAAWTTGGPYGGYVRSLGMAGSTPDIMYAGTEQGIFRTTDSGANWVKPGDAALFALALAVDPVDAAVVYAGTVDGLYKSVDAGVHWTRKGFEGAVVNAVAIHPADTRVLYVGTGVAGSQAAGETTGIFKSLDGGDTWLVKDADGIDAVKTLLIDADNPAWIYAGVNPWGEERRALRKSTDSGETWARIKVTSLSHEAVTCLAMSPAGAQPAMIYAGLNTAGTYKSDDRGATWTHTSHFLPWALLVDPQQAHRVYAGTGIRKIVAPQAEIYYHSELYKSTDRAATWVEKDSGLPEGTIAAMVIDPRNGHIFAGLTYGGVYRSVDGADTWHMAGRGLHTTYIKDLAVHPDATDTVFAAVWGQGHHLARTRNRGGAWQYLTGSQAPAHIGAVAVAAQDPAQLFAGDAYQFNAALHVHRSLDGGQTWIPPGLLFESGDESRVYDIWVHPGNSQVVLAAAGDWARVHGGVYKSTDGGTSFRRTLDHWRATTLAADPQHPEILYCGTYEDGHVFRSADTGETWTRTSPEGFWVSRVKDLAVAANSELYAATTGGLMKWDGVAWNRLAGLPSDDTTAVDLDRSTDPAVIYAGTGDQGVFFSSDQGLTWIPFTAGLANPSITRLAVSRSRPTVVYAGTNLGGVWQTMIIAPGDVNGDRAVDLADAVLALQIAAGTAPTAAVFPEADIDRDLHIGPAEAVYALQAASGERSFRLASSVFIDNNPIPSIYTCDAADVSPPLAWRQVPPGAQSLVLIMNDPDAPGGTWDHWIVYDIPAAVSVLAANAGAPGGEQLPAGARQGTNSWNNSHYQGPCPPGGTHRYFFKLYAVNVTSLNTAGTSKGAVEAAMAGKIVGQAVLMGTYTRLP